nr:bifunctional demethylmenaquinone methyltransferase/2-methoxy-6-polyprenyl-1,4-benzoquinol methylase UbiE [Govania unica]
MAQDDTVSFGFRDVRAGEKAGLVRGVFESVAPKYDIMNDLMSGGLHRLWKNTLVDSVNPRPGMRFLDVAGGTGDVAFRIHDRLRKRWPENPVDISICDINAAMLGVGRDRAIDQNRLNGLTWTCGNAEALPMPDQSFDVYTIAFGIRNVTDRPKALREAYRVLKPGGRFLCLEFSKVVLPGLDWIYDTYSFHAIPAIGGLVAGDRDSYQYLVESIRQFPPQKTFADELTTAGFARASYRNLSGGIVALHSGWRI